jgi:Rieske Fe-S protein
MDPKHEPKVTRRNFCNQALFTSAAVVLAATELKSQQSPAQGLVAYPPMKIEGASQVLPGSFLYFNYPKASDSAVLVHTRDDQYLAFSRKCAHLGCSVDFDTARSCLRCPCHRGVYDSRTGYVVYGPPPRPLDQIVLQIRGGGEIWAVGKRPGGGLNA